MRGNGPAYKASMKAITFQEVGRVSLDEVPEPEILAGTDVVVSVSMAGLCGSDLHPYLGRERGLDPGTIMGHEFIGVVETVGDGVTAFRRGDRVVAPFTTNCGTCFFCRTGLTARCERSQLFGWVEQGQGLHGSQAERVRVPLADATLVRVPEAVEDDAMALLAGDILSTAMFGADLAGVEEGDVVAVVGCGPVGLLAIRAALARGARDVVAVDRVPSRLALAERFGATPAPLEGDQPLLLVRERSEGRGADRAIEAVGTPEATRLAADLLRAGGSLAALGVHSEPHLALAPGEIYDRNLRYAGGRCPARALIPEALRFMQRDTELLRSLISHRMPLAEGVEAYRMFAERREGCTKVVLLP
jgi:threonine dehydrogenase-like Zn-dependent dehydrogenase